MTDNEIIKAWEICANYEYLVEIDRVPTYRGIPLCYLFRETIGFFDRQKAELERLKVELVGMRGAAETYKIHYNKARTKFIELQHKIASCNSEIRELQKEIARLKTENLILSQNRFNLFQRLEYAEKIESKARKEFAERLKEIASEIIIGGKYKYRVVTIESIYNTLAELSNQTEKGGEPDA